MKGTTLDTPLIRTAGRLLSRFGAYIWLALVLAFSIWFGWRNQAEILNIWHSLRAADPTWIAALVGLEIGILALIAITYRSLLMRLGHRVGVPSLVNVHLQRVVVGTVTPVGGPSSMLIFVHRLRQQGIKPADALLTVSIKSVIGNFAFLVLLVPAIWYARELQREDDGFRFKGGSQVAAQPLLRVGKRVVSWSHIINSFNAEGRHAEYVIKRFIGCG